MMRTFLNFGSPTVTMRVSLILFPVLASCLCVRVLGKSEEVKDNQRLRGLIREDVNSAQLRARAEKEISSNDSSSNSHGSNHGGKQMKPKHMRPMHSKKIGKMKMPMVDTTTPKETEMSPPPMITPATKAPSEQGLSPPKDSPTTKLPKGKGAKGGRGKGVRVKGQAMQPPKATASKPKGSMDKVPPKPGKTNNEKKPKATTEDGGSKTPEGDGEGSSSHDHEETLDIPQDAVERSLGLIAFAYSTTSETDPTPADYDELAKVTQETFDYMFRQHFETVDDVSYSDTNIRQYTVLAPLLVQFDISAYFEDDAASVVPTASEARQVAVQSFSSNSDSIVHYISELRVANSAGVFSNVNAVHFISDESELQKLKEQSGGDTSAGDDNPSKAMLSAVIPISAFTAVLLGVFGYALIGRRDRHTHDDDDMNPYSKKAVDDDHSTTSCTYLTDCRTSVFSGDESTGQPSTLDHRLTSSRSQDDESSGLLNNMEPFLEGNEDILEEVSLDDDVCDIEKHVAEVSVSKESPNEGKATISRSIEAFESQKIEPVTVVESQKIEPVTVVESQKIEPVMVVESQKIEPVTVVESQKIKPVAVIESQKFERATVVERQKIDPATGVEDEVVTEQRANVEFVPTAARVVAEVSPLLNEKETEHDGKLQGALKAQSCTLKTHVSSETAPQTCNEAKNIPTQVIKRPTQTREDGARSVLPSASKGYLFDKHTSVVISKEKTDETSQIMPTQVVKPVSPTHDPVKEEANVAHVNRGTSFEKKSTSPHEKTMNAGKPAWMTKREEIMSSQSSRIHDPANKTTASKAADAESLIPEWMQKFHQMGLRKDSD